MEVGCEQACCLPIKIYATNVSILFNFFEKFNFGILLHLIIGCYFLTILLAKDLVLWKEYDSQLAQSPTLLQNKVCTIRLHKILLRRMNNINAFNVYGCIVSSCEIACSHQLIVF